MKKILLISVSLLLLIGCSKEDTVVPEEIQQNLAPEDFELISPLVGAEIDILDITFEWQPAVDPEGDAITYDLYLYRSGSSPIRIAKNLTATSYTLEGNSAFNAAYNWFVVAKDRGGEGKTTKSIERNFITRNIQIAHVLTAGSPLSFSQRYAYTGMYFNNTFFITNGISQDALGDIWSSEDYGKSWSFENDLSDDGFNRYAHSNVIFNDRMYVLGGYQNDRALSDIYVSSDGIDWEEVTLSEVFSPRYEHTSVVFNNKIWIIGGYNEDAFLDEVMSWTGVLEDRWKLEAQGAQTPFNGLRGHSSVVFNNKIWVIGGTDENGYSSGVWVSSDGRNWTAGQSLPIRTTYHKSVVFDDKIWVIGGLTESGPSNEIYYYDKNTATWNAYEMPMGMEIRPLYNHAVVAVNDEGPDDGIYIFGSFNGTEYFNDVWKLY